MRTRCIALLVLALLSLPGCRLGHSAPTEPAPKLSQQSPDIRGVIKELYVPGGNISGFLVEGKLEADTRYDKAQVSVTDATRIFVKRAGEYVTAAVSELKAEQSIEVLFDGPVNTSYPVQAKASEIVILISPLSPTTTPASYSATAVPHTDSWAIPGTLRMARLSGALRAAYYNGCFFVVDADRSQGYGIDLEEERPHFWAVVPQWSPDRHSLAMLTTDGTPPARRVGLSILDASTGKLRPVQLEIHVVPGQYYVMDVAWFPNSQVLAILVTTSEEKGERFDNLYLVNVTTGENWQMAN